MSGRRNGWSDWPPRTKARRVEGGIKAQTKRGAFGARWWAKRWIAVLESFGLGTRLSRGRAYARGGQVVDIALEPGGVRASVQGSRSQPYDVTIRMRELTAREWGAVGTAISANTRLAAMLLAGEMPEDIEAAFSAAGTPLFPKSQHELKTACSCPDFSNPCKHIAAVFYLIGEEFDRDPFLLFVVRGLPRAAVRELLSPPEGKDDKPPVGSNKNVTTSSERVGVTRPGNAKADKARAGKGEAESGSVANGKLKNGTIANGKLRNGTIANGSVANDERDSPKIAIADSDAGESTSDRRAFGEAPSTIAPPVVDAILLQKAGRFPFWRAAEELEEALAPIYARATGTALAWLADHRDS